jgi:hypothetical protein
MKRTNLDMDTKLFDRTALASTMMFIDNQRISNNENYQSIYHDFNPEDSNSELDDDRDVKIWIPISSRI